MRIHESSVTEAPGQLVNTAPRVSSALAVHCSCNWEGPPGSWEFSELLSLFTLLLGASLWEKMLPFQRNIYIAQKREIVITHTHTHAPTCTHRGQSNTPTLFLRSSSFDCQLHYLAVGSNYTLRSPSYPACIRRLCPRDH